MEDKLKQAIDDIISATEKIRNGNDLGDEIMQPIYDALLGYPTLIRKDEAQKINKKLKSKIREFLYLLQNNQANVCNEELVSWLKEIEDGGK